MKSCHYQLPSLVDHLPSNVTPLIMKDSESLTYFRDSKEKVDRRLLSICDQHEGTVMRLPGQLKGHQFKIMNCTSLQIWILDHTNSVLVDNCRDCQIVIGPTTGR